MTYFPTNTPIYTIIIIGLSTYLIVFNLEIVVLQGSKVYDIVHDQVIQNEKHWIQVRALGQDEEKL